MTYWLESRDLKALENLVDLRRNLFGVRTGNGQTDHRNPKQQRD